MFRKKFLKIAKHTKTDTNSSKQESVNEIKDISNNETQDKDTLVPTDLHDLEISTDSLDF